MFYDLQSNEDKNDYKRLLKATGALSRLFSEDEKPFIYYRAHENIFSLCFHATNNARSDDTADAYKDKIGIGLKTWVGGNNQKIAEFGELRPTYENLHGIDLVKKIADYRNKRIKATKAVHGLESMIYHVVKRVPHKMEIYESIMDEIDIENITLLEDRGRDNSNYFTDGKHTYNFLLSKNTLYMIFDDMVFYEDFDVEILEDPYSFIKKLVEDDTKQVSSFQVVPENYEELIAASQTSPYETKEKLCLRLYTINRTTKEKIIENASGLNQWHGIRTSNRTLKDGTVIHTESQRNPDELYIPYPVEDQRRNPLFFPENEQGEFERFELELPNGNTIYAKRCQSGGKGIMSDPNKDLGHWLLRDVFQLKEGTLVTYELLQILNIDSVIFTKINSHKFKIDFCPLGTYENYYSTESDSGNN